jgi:hypothetical protein
LRDHLHVKSVEALCEEIGRLNAMYGARVFHIAGQATPAPHVAAVAAGIRARGMQIVYTRESDSAFGDCRGTRGQRASAMRLLFAGLRESGCVALRCRIESGSQRLLDAHYERPLSVSQVEGAFREAKRAGLQTVAGFTYPCAADDYHTRAETLRLVQRCLPDVVRVRLPGPANCEKDGNTAAQGRDKGGRRFMRALRCRTLFPLPRDRWRTVPCGVGKLSAGQAIAAQEDLIHEIETLGVVATGQEELPVLAAVTRYQGDLRRFGVGIAGHFLTGDATGIDTLVRRFNDSACVPARDAAIRLYGGMRKAVGN